MLPEDINYGRRVVMLEWGSPIDSLAAEVHIYTVVFVSGGV